MNSMSTVESYTYSEHLFGQPVLASLLLKHI